MAMTALHDKSLKILPPPLRLLLDSEPEQTPYLVGLVLRHQVQRPPAHEVVDRPQNRLEEGPEHPEPAQLVGLARALHVGPAVIVCAADDAGDEEKDDEEHLQAEVVVRQPPVLRRQAFVRLVKGVHADDAVDDQVEDRVDQVHPFQLEPRARQHEGAEAVHAEGGARHQVAEMRDAHREPRVDVLHVVQVVVEHPEVRGVVVILPVNLRFGLRAPLFVPPDLAVHRGRRDGLQRRAADHGRHRSRASILEPLNPTRRRPVVSPASALSER
mmetsp:Transcript_10157/g.46517  ORF Transcript_10157/g.46517 Transcript_10157/m.46517 type:complete len:271 (-) Transcript_10157:188-1000(-)